MSHSFGCNPSGQYMSTAAAIVCVQVADDRRAQVGAFEYLAALAVDGLALDVHYVVVFENVLAHIEVVHFDFLLRALDHLREQLRVQRLVLPPSAQQERLRLVAEQPPQLVFKRHEEPRRARVALSAGPSAELVVDSPAFVPLRADYIQPAALYDVQRFRSRVFELVRVVLLPGVEIPGQVRQVERRQLLDWSPRPRLALGISRVPPRMMSTPRPAMLVAMVTAPRRPAWEMICASISWYFAFRTLWTIPSFERLSQHRLLPRG